MLWVNLPVVHTIFLSYKFHKKSNKFATSVKIKATGESKHNDNFEFIQASCNNYNNNKLLIM